MGNDPRLMQELEGLKKKLQILEDKEAIRDVLARYAFNADLNRTENFVKLWTDDGTFTSDAAGKKLVFKGKKEIGNHLLDPLHQSYTNRSQHLQVNYVINVEGDTASATGFQLISRRWEGGFGIVRCAFRSFRFRRVDGRWLIQESISIATGEPDCQKLVPMEW